MFTKEVNCTIHAREVQSMLEFKSHCKKEGGIIMGLGNTSSFFKSNKRFLERSSARTLLIPRMWWDLTLKLKYASTKKRPQSIHMSCPYTTLSEVWPPPASLSQIDVTLQPLHEPLQTTATIITGTNSFAEIWSCWAYLGHSTWNNSHPYISMNLMHLTSQTLLYCQCEWTVIFHSGTHFPPQHIWSKLCIRTYIMMSLPSHT